MGHTSHIPDWLTESTRSLLTTHGIEDLWRHQAAALSALNQGSSVVIATGTASGKSLVYQTMAAESCANSPRNVTLYISPTKALGHDQQRSAAWTQLRTGVLDGDTPRGEREWIRHHAQLVITNPDLLHRTLLPQHRYWQRLFRHLSYIVVDECHMYRGIFGSHVALVLRRLRRLAALYGSNPPFVVMSASVSDPETLGSTLTGVNTFPIVDDGAPRSELTLHLGEPREGVSPWSVAAHLLSREATAGRTCLAFIPSRAGVERVSILAQEINPDLPVRAYRSGYLSEERRDIEQGLRSGSVQAIATTNALELGIDIPTVDSVVVCGWPGKFSSLWQQLGRAGRRQSPSTGYFIAEGNTLDHFLVEHPHVVLDRHYEPTVIDPSNTHLLAGHLVAAAYEKPLENESVFPDTYQDVCDSLIASGTLRQRPTGLYWPTRTPPRVIESIRGNDAPEITLVRVDSGQIVGTAAGHMATRTLFPGAVYVHQGQHFTVVHWEPGEEIALLQPCDAATYTVAQSHTHLSILHAAQQRRVGALDAWRGSVQVSTQVTGYQRRRSDTHEVLSHISLDYPAVHTDTKAVWWTWTHPPVESADIPGGVHALEHAAIGLLPLLVSCDRWDIGGLSTPDHPDTHRPTVFVYEASGGGFGYVDRAFDIFDEWMAHTVEAIEDCDCDQGCPRCIYSPKCGNGNEPLEKNAAVLLGRQALS